jgi:hypothetical protein
MTEHPLVHDYRQEFDRRGRVLPVRQARDSGSRSPRTEFTRTRTRPARRSGSRRTVDPRVRGQLCINYASLTHSYASIMVGFRACA